MSQIKFKCTQCDKVIRADLKFAGKVAQCPGCQTKLRVPTPRGAGSSQPGAQSSPSATPPSVQPQAPAPFDPFGDLPSAAAPQAPTPAASDPFGQDLGLPAGPEPSAVGNEPFAAGNEYSAAGNEYSAAGNEYSAAYSPPTRAPAAPPTNTAPEDAPSFGRSLAALLAGGFLAVCCSVVWVIVALFAELGILAWGIGGLIGFVCGKVGRNPSPVFCGLVAGLAAFSILFAKTILACGLMFVSFGVNMIDEFANMPNYLRMSAAIKSDMIDRGELVGDQAAVAKYEAEEYFLEDSPDIQESTGLDDETFWEVSEALELTVREHYDALDDAAQDALLDKARTKYPGWIEQYEHYLAAAAKLRREGKLAGDLLRFADYELATLDDEWDDQYEDNVSYNEQSRLRRLLREESGQMLSQLSESEIDALVLETIEQHPLWNALPDDRLVVMEKMYRDGEFSGPLKKHVEASLDMELRGENFEYYESIPSNTYEALDKELNQAVGEQLSNYSSEQRKQMISDLSAKHDYWTPQSEFDMDAMFDDEFAEVERELNEVGADGTFWGSFKAVFSWFDILWLFLGITTAFSVAYKQGGGMSST